MKKLGWALVGTGKIVEKFLIGLRAAQGVGSICVVSRDEARAHAFAEAHGLRRGYGSLAGALADPEVDLVYIGSPHVAHRDQAVQALEAHKAVLCEKPVCISAREMKEVARAARENQTFFMEAMWTRYMPAVRRARDWMNAGEIGQVKAVQAAFSFRSPLNPQHRLFDKSLGGGALLDVGIYPVSFASMVFGGQKAKEIKAMMTLGETGVDEETIALLDFGGGRLATVAAGIRTTMKSDAWIYGTKGSIHLTEFYAGRRAVLRREGQEAEVYAPEIMANGMNYEAEEAMSCVREGKLESGSMTLAESISVMEMMDEIRAQGGLVYPGEKG